jgi:hypothetical protein
VTCPAQPHRRAALSTPATAASTAVIQADTLSLNVQGSIAADALSSISGVPTDQPVLGLSVAANTLSAQGGSRVWIDNLSTGALTLHAITAGKASPATTGDLRLRMLASSVSVTADIKALGTDGRLELDAGGNGGSLSIANGVSLQATRVVLDSTIDLRHCRHRSGQGAAARIRDLAGGLGGVGRHRVPARSAGQPRCHARERQAPGQGRRLRQPEPQRTVR